MNYSSDLVKKIEIGTRRPVEVFILRCAKLLQIPAEYEQSFLMFAHSNTWTNELEAIPINEAEDDSFSTLARFSMRHGQLISMVVVEDGEVRHKIVRVQIEQSTCVLHLSKDVRYILVKSKGITGSETLPDPQTLPQPS